MDARATRLGRGEWLLGVSSALLLVDLFGVDWFGYAVRVHAAATYGRRISTTGWQSFDVIGPLALVVCAAGLAAAWFTASRQSPAVPAVIATLLTPVAFLLALLVAIRVLLDRPGVHLAQAGGGAINVVRPGAVAGVVLSVAVFSGCFLSLRRDGVAAADSPASIPTMTV